MTLNEVAVASAKDKEIGSVKVALQTNNWDTLRNSRYKILKEQLCLYKNILLKNTRIIISEALRKKTLALTHEKHPEIVAMKQLL